jgi:hypothetical protein
MPSDLQNLINAIPRAEDGNVISSQYHNSLRAALAAIANQLGAGPSHAETARSFAPNFLPVIDAGVRSPEWLLSVGIASKPGASARGWFPVQLPDGGTINSMTVTGQRSGTVTSCQVRLVRQTITDATSVPMITVSLKTVTGQPFKVTADVTGASLPIIQDFRAVDNDKYQYLVVAELVNAAADAVVDLFAIQIALATP